MRLKTKQRQALFEKYGGRCAYCGCNLPVKGWHADHMEPVYRQSDFDHRKKRFVRTGKMLNPEWDTPDNLMPACPSCNLYKGGMTVEAFRSELSKQVKRARAGSKNFRMAEKFGLVSINRINVVFYFEKQNGQKKEY